MFGKQIINKSQNEKTPFHPMSIYGVSKVFAYHTCVYYREAFGFMHLMEFYLIMSLKKRPNICYKKLFKL